MKTVILNSYDDIDSFIKSIQNLNMVFRGQSCATHKLQTRIADKLKVTSKIKETAKQIMLAFKNELLRTNLTNELYVDNSSFNDWLLIFQAQHLGIPTFVLDFTIDWRKALFFAAFDEKNNNSSGQLWCLDATGQIFEPINSGYNDPYIYDEGYKIINVTYNEGWESYASEKRKQIQGGRFLIYPMSDLYTPIENTHLRDRLILIEITPECKEKIRYKYIHEGKTPVELKNFVSDFQEKRSYDHSFFYPSMSSELLAVVNSVRVQFDFPVLDR
jgi:hypothetical protein